MMADFVLHYFGSPLTRLDHPALKSLGRGMAIVALFSGCGIRRSIATHRQSAVGVAYGGLTAVIALFAPVVQPLQDGRSEALD